MRTTDEQTPPADEGPVERTVRPRLLPSENYRWGLLDGCYVERAGHDAGLRDMCDYGAERFHEGYCDLVNFDCMPYEVERIKGYMAEKHSGVAYAIGPAQRTLAHAVAAWEAVQGPNVQLRGGPADGNE